MFNIFVYLNITFVVEQNETRICYKDVIFSLYYIAIKRSNTIITTSLYLWMPFRGYIYTPKVCPKEDDLNSFMDGFK
jgi:hypothetical protein